MKIKPLITTLVFASVFALSYVGVSYSRSTEKIAGEELTVSSLTISSAMAKCSEINVWYNPGVCDATQRCLPSASGPGDCSLP